jgi:hypothetical protein
MKWLTILVLAIAIAASLLAALLYAAGRTDDDAYPPLEFQLEPSIQFGAFFQKQRSTPIRHNRTHRNLEEL